MKIETLAFGFGLIEGPRVDPAGNLYFSDVTNGGVFRRSPSGAIETVVPRRRGVGGIAIHADGGIVISGRNVCHVRDGATRVLFARDDVPGWNDLFTDAQGRVYTGSMLSNPFGDERERKLGECFRIEAEGRATPLYGGVSLSNGIGFSPDGRRIYHSDTAIARVHVHELDAAGRAKPLAPILVAGSPDGLAVDSEGCVWVALYREGAIARFAPDGSPDRRIEVPAKAVTSLCFGGPDLRDLYVVSADNTEDPSRNGSIFRMRSDVAGLAAPLARI
ncbi:MAG: SMP-30/gluconolactonase/LRE family protein [Deltaproteobacteria bacterium]|nr:SMP-30/gluconolactonase/LRE family protein [Deltaproteobacteria bacterium]